MYIKDRFRRSMMFIPGNNPGMIRDANIYGADSIMFDLEDSVAYTEMTELMEHIFGLPEVQRAVRHMEITHINQANRGKELKANGTIPLHSNPNETQ